MKMRISARITVCLSIIISLFIINSGQAEDLSGKIVNIRGGRLERLSNGKWIELKKDSRVSFGDRLRTDKSGLAVAELPGVGRFVIGPDSEIELGKQDKNFKADVARGEVWMKSGLPKGNNASISTSLATAGVRGTKFSTLFYKGNALCFCTCAGSVDVALKDGRVIPVPGGTIYAMWGDKPAPDKPESALPLLEKKGKGFDFCFNCHTEGGRGRLRPDWE